MNEIEGYEQLDKLDNEMPIAVELEIQEKGYGPRPLHLNPNNPPLGLITFGAN